MIDTLTTSVSLRAGRKLLQADSEGFSVSSLTPYLKYVDAKCGDPAKVTGNCLTLKNHFCGTRDTSEVLCTDGKDAEASFRSASRYGPCWNMLAEQQLSHVAG